VAADLTRPKGLFAGGLRTEAAPFQGADAS
jgi:hypothetical protein